MQSNSGLLGICWRLIRNLLEALQKSFLSSKRKPQKVRVFYFPLMLRGGVETSGTTVAVLLPS